MARNGTARRRIDYRFEIKFAFDKRSGIIHQFRIRRTMNKYRSRIVVIFVFQRKIVDILRERTFKSPHVLFLDLQRTVYD